MRNIQITSVSQAVYIYYACPELENSDIRALFGNLSSATVTRLKKRAQELQREQGVNTLGRYTVNTKCAYNAWGLDIADLESRLKKLKALGMEERRDNHAKEAQAAV